MKFVIYSFLLFCGWGLSPLCDAQPDTLTDKDREELDKTVGKGRINQFLKGYHKAFSAPINFWGKVVDEKGHEIANAKVMMRPTTGLDNWDESSKIEYLATSDQSGLFSLLGKNGATLFVAVSKNGYQRTEKSAKTFTFGSADDWVPTGLPTVEKPAVFVLRKKGEAGILIWLRDLRYPLAKDGKPEEVNLQTGAVSAANEGDLKIEFWSEAPTREEEHQMLLKKVQIPNYNWKCRVTILGGGFASRGEFDFEAPEQGYEETLTIAMTKDAGKWRDRQERQLFFKTKGGTYGRMKLNLYAVPEGNIIYVKGYYNPLNSRNLESDSKKLIDSKEVERLGLVKAVEEFQKTHK